MRLCILSPHRDDAAFSAGLAVYSALKAGWSVTIMNIMTVSNYAPFSPGTASAVTVQRRHEDERFADCLERLTGCRPKFLDLEWLDLPLRLNLPLADLQKPETYATYGHDQTVMLKAEFNNLIHQDIIYAPLALGGHFDHRITRDAACSVFSGQKLAFYEDLPYIVRIPAQRRKTSFQSALAEAQIGNVFHASLRCDGGEALRCILAGYYQSQVSDDIIEEMSDYTIRHGERFFARQNVLNGLQVVSRLAAGQTFDRQIPATPAAIP